MEQAIRAVWGGQPRSTQLGLLALVYGAVAITVIMALLTPVVGSIADLPSIVFSEPQVQTQVRHERQLTRAQQVRARKLAVRAAVSQVGVRERRGNSNNSPTIVTYRRAVFGRGERARAAEPWCADFVSWSWRRAKQPIGFNGRGSDYVPELVVWAKWNRRWHWARDGYKPRAGDLIVYRSGGSREGHIGMVVRLSPGRVHTVEGNYGNRVARRVVAPWRPDVTGFISPV